MQHLLHKRFVNKCCNSIMDLYITPTISNLLLCLHNETFLFYGSLNVCTFMAIIPSLDKRLTLIFTIFEIWQNITWNNITERFSFEICKPAVIDWWWSWQLPNSQKLTSPYNCKDRLMILVRCNICCITNVADPNKMGT